MSVSWTWRLRDRTLTPGDPPLVMGIVNVTPDSFSDGGRFLGVDAAVAQGLRLIEQGADLLDLGGESSRPGAQPVSLEEELSRVVPVVRRLAEQTSAPLSVDTCKAEVARQALEAGAHIINDITALQGDPAMPEVARTLQAGVVLMHMRGTPATMQIQPHYDDVVVEVLAFLEARLQASVDLGIAASQVVLDPGIGFGKTSAPQPAIVGPSGGAATSGPARVFGGVAQGVSRSGAGSSAGAAVGRLPRRRLLRPGSPNRPDLRVHDVAETRDAVALFEARWNA